MNAELREERAENVEPSEMEHGSHQMDKDARVARGPVCLNCGYNLTAIDVHGFCPDCGYSVEASRKGRYSERLSLRERAKLGDPTAAGALFWIAVIGGLLLLLFLILVVQMAMA